MIDFNAQQIIDAQEASPILFEKEVLGTANPVKVGGYKGRIVLPKLDPLASNDQKFKEVVAPSGFNRGVLHLLGDNNDEPISWGKQVIYPTGETLIWRFLLETKVKRTRVVARKDLSKIEESFSKWFSLLRTWLEVLTHQDLSVSEPLPDMKITSSGGVWSWLSRTVWRSTGPSIQPIAITLPSKDRAVSLSQWRSAIGKANKLEDPPDVHVLLRDARAGLHRGRYNTCILHSAIAAELILKRSLEKELRRGKNSQKLIDALLENCTFGKLLGLCNKFDLYFPQDTGVKVKKVRDNVVHENYTANRQEASDCLEVSTAVIKSYTTVGDLDSN